MKGNALGPPPKFRHSLLLLALGFGTSAVAAYGTVYGIVLCLLGARRPNQTMCLAAAILLAVWFLFDTGAFGLHTPMWPRQTPRHLFFRYGPARGALLWGLDSGLVFTTFRVTSLSWAALTVTVLGLVPWWSGVAYALGFSVPVVLLTLMVPRRADAHARRPQDPIWLMQKLTDVQPIVRGGALVILAGSAVASLGVALVTN